VTEEKITEIAFVGSIGGVLGLFLGFSFISAVEIIFIFCLQPIYRRFGMDNFKKIKKIHKKRNSRNLQKLKVTKG
jgi:ABC-type lipoprotein release transport system permease subunit